LKREGELGIIPGSMGARSYIVRGKGNPESFCSCAHGAGRRMSRSEAKRRFSRADLVEQTQGVECRKDKGVLDEIPGAYKDIEQVMADQADLVTVLHTLQQDFLSAGDMYPFEVEVGRWRVRAVEMAAEVHIDDLVEVAEVVVVHG